MVIYNFNLKSLSKLESIQRPSGSRWILQHPELEPPTELAIHLQVTFWKSLHSLHFLQDFLGLFFDVKFSPNNKRNVRQSIDMTYVRVHKHRSLHRPMPLAEVIVGRYHIRWSFKVQNRLLVLFTDLIPFKKYWPYICRNIWCPCFWVEVLKAG